MIKFIIKSFWDSIHSGWLPAYLAMFATLCSFNPDASVIVRLVYLATSWFFAEIYEHAAKRR